MKASEAERQLLRDAAADRGVTISDLIRQALADAGVVLNQNRGGSNT